MKQWEHDHPDKCIRQRDEGQFFGFTEVGQGYLARFTRLISIPAVRDAAEDASEGRGRPITEILDLVIRATLANRDELKQLRRETQEQYDQMMANATAGELGELQGRLTETLKTYVPDAEVQLQWITEGGIELSMPKADVKLTEHGYSTAVSKAGHGLQRAFILTMLQHLTAAQSLPIDQGSQEGPPEVSETPGGSSSDTMTPMPSIVLTIEEPELYQHPSRQRHLANVLMKLASGTLPGVAKRTQVIYSTHSPLFVGIDRFNQVRVLRKVAHGEGLPKATKVVEAKGDAVAEALWEACEGKDRNEKTVHKFTWETLKPRLQAIMNPWMSEGFFADVVVLVEGEGDRAAILGTALAMNHDFESLGIAVIPAGGKPSLDRPYVIFRSLEIPVYVIWDSDGNKTGAKPRENHILLRLVGETVTDWPSGIYERFACFENTLEDLVCAEIGLEKFDFLLAALQAELGYSNKDDALKNPQVFRELLQKSHSQGAKCETLESIIDSILKVKGIEVVTS